MKIEKKFKDITPDKVSYRTLEVKNNLLSESKNAYCYANHYRKMEDFSFELYPLDNEKSILPKDIYFNFITLCEENGLLPHGCVPWSEDDRNKLYIPSNPHRCQTYAALCCYRWVETRANLPLNICEAVSKGVNFYQALFWACAKIVDNYGHSFHKAYAGGSYAKLNLYEMFGCHSLYQKEFENIKVLSSGNAITDIVYKKTIEISKDTIAIKAEDFLKPELKDLFNLNPKELKESLTKLKNESNFTSK
jgi:hypothetical protein